MGTNFERNYFSRNKRGSLICKSIVRKGRRRKMTTDSNIVLPHVNMFLAHVNDPLVLGGKVSHVQAGKGESQPCANCGQIVNFIPDKLYTVNRVACSTSCADILFFAPGRKEDEIRKEEQKICSIIF